MATRRKVQHLFLRAAFSESPQVIDTALSKSVDQLVDELFESSKEYRDIEYLPYPLEDREDKKLSGLDLLILFLKSFKEREELNNEWIFKMAYTKAVLRERMTFFWHNHFATSTPFAYLMQVQNNMLRKHAMGKFSDMLYAVAKDPAMILYLNNQENRKEHPNENFAREVMELFTLGRGNYSEHDIKEAARAFTGWTVNRKGQYEFHSNEHDFDEKEFLGKKGNFNGEDVLAIILENKQTARFITTKIYAEFVNTDVNQQRVETLADSFFKSGYDIGALMKTIFTSDWFYDDENIGCKIASPVELIVRYKKLMAMEFKKPDKQVQLQKLLGMVLFFPPNVAGWKGGKTWIDSATLMIRMSIPKMMLKNFDAEYAAKPQYEMNPDKPVEKFKAGDITTDWKDLVKYFSTVEDNDLAETILENFIQSNNVNLHPGLIDTGKDSNNKRDTIKMIAHTMSLPDFQMI